MMMMMELTKTTTTTTKSKMSAWRTENVYQVTLLQKIYPSTNFCVCSR